MFSTTYSIDSSMGPGWAIVDSVDRLCGTCDIFVIGNNLQVDAHLNSHPRGFGFFTRNRGDRNEVRRIDIQAAK